MPERNERSHRKNTERTHFSYVSPFMATSSTSAKRTHFSPAPAKIENRFDMDRPAAATPATARDIILEIVRNMREGLEPLHYTTLPPAVFHVYLHPDDFERLRGIVPKIVEEARRALDAEVESLNRTGGLAARLKLNKFSKRNEPKVVAPDGGWQVALIE